jgi:hypothetical protein
MVCVKMNLCLLRLLCLKPLPQIANFALHWFSEHPYLVIYLWVHGLVMTVVSLVLWGTLTFLIAMVTKNGLVAFFAAFAAMILMSLSLGVTSDVMWLLTPSFLNTLWWWLRVVGGAFATLAQFFGGLFAANAAKNKRA